MRERRGDEYVDKDDEATKDGEGPTDHGVAHVGQPAAPGKRQSGRECVAVSAVVRLARSAAPSLSAPPSSISLSCGTKILEWYGSGRVVGSAHDFELSAARRYPVVEIVVGPALHVDRPHRQLSDCDGFGLCVVSLVFVAYSGSQATVSTGWSSQCVRA